MVRLPRNKTRGKISAQHPLEDVVGENQDASSREGGVRNPDYCDECKTTEDVLTSIVCPAPQRKVVRVLLEPRLGTLDGKTITLYDNTRNTAAPMLEAVEEFLLKQGVKVIKVRSPDSSSKHPENLIVEAAKADGVVLATADCGSCTPWLADAAMRIERRGRPTCILTGRGFESEVQSHAKHNGFLYLPVVVVDYPNLDPMIVRKATEKILDEVVKILTTSSQVLQ